MFNFSLTATAKDSNRVSPVRIGAHGTGVHGTHRWGIAQAPLASYQPAARGPCQRLRASDGARLLADAQALSTLHHTRTVDDEVLTVAEEGLRRHKAEQRDEVDR